MAIKNMTAKNDLLRRIQDEYATFSKSQKMIGSFILEHYDKAAYMTAARLGEEVGVSESTVVRFATELGCDGYPGLQQGLRELIRTKLTSIQRIEITNDRIGGGDALDAVLEADIDRIRMTRESINRSHFDAAVEQLLGAHVIYIAGVRTSSALASFLYCNFNLIFENVKLIGNTSGSEIFERMLHIGPGDVFVALSFPRYSKRMINAVEFAKSRGATVIAVTDSETAPIACAADCLLIAKSDMVSFVDSLVAPLSVLNALIVAIARKKKGELEKSFTVLEDIWDRFEVYDKEHDE